MPGNRGWFADLSDEEDRNEVAPWQLFIQCDGLCLPLGGTFQSKEDAEAFLRSDILGKRWLDAERQCGPETLVLTPDGKSSYIRCGCGASLRPGDLFAHLTEDSAHD